MILTPHQPHQRHGDERETETEIDRYRERERQRERERERERDRQTDRQTETERVCKCRYVKNGYPDDSEDRKLVL